MIKRALYYTSATRCWKFIRIRFSVAAGLYSRIIARLAGERGNQPSAEGANSHNRSGTYTATHSYAVWREIIDPPKGQVGHANVNSQVKRTEGAATFLRISVC